MFQEIRPGAGFKTDYFVEEMLGGLPQNDSFADKWWGSSTPVGASEGKFDEIS